MLNCRKIGDHFDCFTFYRKDEIMNSEFSQGEFTLDVGERLLQGMQALRDELNTFGNQIQNLTTRAQDIVPLKQRRQPVTRPLSVYAICNYKQNNVRGFLKCLIKSNIWSVVCS